MQRWPERSSQPRCAQSVLHRNRQRATARAAFGWFLWRKVHMESTTLKFAFEDSSDMALVRWNRDHQPHRDRLSTTPEFGISTRLSD